MYSTIKYLGGTNSSDGLVRLNGPLGCQEGLETVRNPLAPTYACVKDHESDFLIEGTVAQKVNSETDPAVEIKECKRPPDNGREHSFFKEFEADPVQGFLLRRSDFRHGAPLMTAVSNIPLIPILGPYAKGLSHFRGGTMAQEVERIMDKMKFRDTKSFPGMEMGSPISAEEILCSENKKTPLEILLTSPVRPLSPAVRSLLGGLEVFWNWDPSRLTKPQPSQPESKGSIPQQSSTSKRVLNVLKSDGTEAGRRIIAKQLFKFVHACSLALLKQDHGTYAHQLKKLASLLETDLGKGGLYFLLSLILESQKDLAKELRIQAMEQAGKAAIEMVSEISSLFIGQIRSFVEDFFNRSPSQDLQMLLKKHARSISSPDTESVEEKEETPAVVLV